MSTTPTNIPEGFNIDPKGDNCKVKIEGVWITVAQLARLYKRAWHECSMWRSKTPPKLVNKMHDDARREAGLS